MVSSRFFQWIDLLPGRPLTRLKTSPGARLIGQNVAWLGADKVFSIGLALGVSIVVARYLGKADFGLFSYSLAFITLFKVLGDVGLEEVLIRDLVRYPEQRYEILGTAFGMRLVAGLTVMGVIAVVVQFVRPNDALARYLVMITSLTYIPQSAMVTFRWFNAKLLAKYNVLSSNTALIAMSAVRLALVYFHASLTLFVWTNVGLILVNAVVLLGFYLYTGESVAHWRFRWSWCRQLFHDAWPQIPNGLAGAVMTQLGALMIGNMLGDAEVGPYAVAYRFFILLLMVPDIVCQSLVPNLTQLKSNDETLFRRRMAQSYRLLFFLYLATLVPTLVLGLWGIRILYGPQFVQAGRLIILFSVPILFIYLGLLRMWFIIIDNRIRYMMYVSLVQTVVLLVSNYLLIKWLGAAGAVMAMAAGALFVLLVDAVVPSGRRYFTTMLRGLGLVRL